MVAPGGIVRRLALLVGSAAALGGCFYVEPINQRPAIDIRLRSGDDPQVERGQQDVTLEAVVNDPEGQIVQYSWRVQACDVATDATTCDPEPIASSELEVIDFDVPLFRADGVTAPKELRVVLDARDELGASAKPSQELVLLVVDAAPAVTLFEQRPYDGIVGTPIDLFLEYTDVDDGAARVTFEIRARSQQTLTEVAVTDIANVPPSVKPGHLQIGKRFVPTEVGPWEVEILAHSPGGRTTTIPHLTTANTDLPPCLGQLTPAVAPAATPLPLSDASLFQVLLVSDGLDRFPTDPDDPLLGSTRFEWSLRVGGGARQALGTTGNAVELDPANFTLGEILELRVEIFDRNDTPVTCADDLASCSVIATSCLQRQTWFVEVR